MNSINFLSEENVVKHREYLKELKLLYSVLEKSYPSLLNKEICDIERLRLPGEIKKEALMRKNEITLHELFFDSFSNKKVRCNYVSDCYGSEASFLYEIERAAFCERGIGFLVVGINEKSKPDFYFCEDRELFSLKFRPVLAIDMWEHAYISDYGFDRKKYIKSALFHLNLDKINDFYKRD